MTDLVIIEKIRVSITDQDFTQNIGVGHDDIIAANIRWLQYTTASINNKEMIIAIEELGSAGTKWNNNQGSNKKYFLSFPLDQASQVTCSYANFTSQVDIQYQNERSLNTLHFNTLINGLPAYDISPSNPLELELILYRRKQ